MIFKKSNWFILFSIFLLSLFEIILLINGKTELAYYNFMLLLMFILISFLFFKFKIPIFYLIGLLFVGLLNVIGGLVFIDGVRLYDTYFWFFKLDMLIHFIALFFTTLIIFFILGNFIEKKSKNKYKIYLIIVSGLSALGIGAFFEILEFLGVVILKNSGVGDYVNNVLDLIFNLLGIFFASLFILFKRNG